MAEYRRPFQCEVVTPQGKAYGGEIISAVIPAADGLLGILGGHSPMVALMVGGPMRLRLADGQKLEYYVAHGFAQFAGNALTLLVEECLPSGELDPDEAYKDMERATTLPQDSPEQREVRQEDIKAARWHLRMAQQYAKAKAL
jgi:F-type H+-transporting ATPase subunit epsilon